MPAVTVLDSTMYYQEQGSLRVTVVLLSTALWLKFVFASFMLQPNFTAEWVSTGRYETLDLRPLGYERIVHGTPIQELNVV